MVADQEKLFGDDDAEDAERQEYERLRNRLSVQIGQIADEEDISSAMLALLLIDLGVTHRMLDYVLSVEKPSASGLKLDLDRFRREIDEYMRGSKKSADEFVTRAKEALAAEERATSTEAGEGPNQVGTAGKSGL
jgi:hypothetical protein